jgi:uncharacterized protein (TIGR02594 family)
MSKGPKWLTVMRTITGLTETPGDADNPKIIGMAEYIAQAFPEQQSYCDQYTNDSIAWCGLCAAYCMAVCGIRGPFGATDTDKWMWALSWSDDPNYMELDEPKLGCVVVLEREGGGHVTLYESTSGSNYMCRGGNQSDAVNLAPQAISNVVGLYWPVSEPVPVPPPSPGEDHPELSIGSQGPWVVYMQSLTPIIADGDFGGDTDSALRFFQQTHGLEADGVCGPMTWDALENQEAPVPPKPPEPAPGELTKEQQAEIRGIAMDSDIAEYDWNDRGEAPIGYTEGMALAFATSYRRLKSGDSSGVEMAKANTHNDDKDALSWYNSNFKSLGMSNDKAGPDTLRHLYVLLLGLGMRESSGQHCEGRDMSASNTSSDTCEAGLFQTSYDAHPCSSEFDKLFNEARGGQSPCYLDTFKQEVSCSSDSWDCYGSGDGYEFQELCKVCPVFAAESCAIVLRNLRKHYGPINEKAAEIRPEADEMFKKVQDYVDQIEAVA